MGAEKPETRDDNRSREAGRDWDGNPTRQRGPFLNLPPYGRPPIISISPAKTEKERRRPPMSRAVFALAL
ncbi:MAG TPA: hypothetical protein VF215_17630, partial [Thermoanaerobaculia bacterium]